MTVSRPSNPRPSARQICKCVRSRTTVPHQVVYGTCRHLPYCLFTVREPPTYTSKATFRGDDLRGKQTTWDRNGIGSSDLSPICTSSQSIKRADFTRAVLQDHPTGAQDTCTSVMANVRMSATAIWIACVCRCSLPRHDPAATSMGLLLQSRCSGAVWVSVTILLPWCDCAALRRLRESEMRYHSTGRPAAE